MNFSSTTLSICLHRISVSVPLFSSFSLSFFSFFWEDRKEEKTGRGDEARGRRRRSENNRKKQKTSTTTHKQTDKLERGSCQAIYMSSRWHLELGRKQRRERKRREEKRRRMKCLERVELIVSQEAKGESLGGILCFSRSPAAICGRRLPTLLLRDSSSFSSVSSSCCYSLSKSIYSPLDIQTYQLYRKKHIYIYLCMCFYLACRWTDI